MCSFFVCRCTAPLPFITCVVALATGFFGLAVATFLLGVTSVCYWWWPFTDNPWRWLDIITVGLCVSYSFTIGARLKGPWRLVWLVGLSTVVLSIVTNETVMYLRLLSADAARENIWKLNLRTHAVCAHIVINAVASTVLLVMWAVGEQSPVRV